mgnify:CR=1 FL=1
MYQVKGEYTNYQKYNNKGWFHLDSDQALNPYTWKAPIHWSGLVDGIEVKFTQIDSSALSVNSFAVSIAILLDAPANRYVFIIFF